MRTGFILLIFMLLALTGCAEQKSEFPATPAEDFCGFSTFGNCSSDSDCTIEGCNDEVCASIFEEEVVTLCESKPCYNHESYAIECSCVQTKCQWAKFVDVSAEEAHSLIMSNVGNPDFIVIDVRTVEEYSSGHIENALNIDYYSKTFSDELNLLDKNKSYFIYCRSGQRSAASVEIMKELGFIEIYNLKDGINSWKDEGFPLVTPAPESKPLLNLIDSFQ